MKADKIKLKSYARSQRRLISIYRVVWKSLLVLYAKDVLTDLVTIHHGQPRWQYCTQVRFLKAFFPEDSKGFWEILQDSERFKRIL